MSQRQNIRNAYLCESVETIQGAMYRHNKQGKAYLQEMIDECHREGVDNHGRTSAFPTIIRCPIGYRGRKTMPCSEVCMHMGVADHEIDFEIMANEMVQLYITDDDVTPHALPQPFSSSILPGEAGIYQDDEGLYYYA